MIYRYKAVNSQGKEIAGYAMAETVALLQEQLRERGRFLVSSSPLRPQARWSLAEREHIFYELGALISAGVTLADAMRILGEETPKQGQELLEWCAGIEAGKSLSKCAAESDKLDDPVIIKMLEVGEATGELALCLRQVAAFQSDLNNLRRKVISALIYPAIVVIVSLAAVLVLTFYVIPMFLDMFRRFEVELPLITNILLWFSDFIKDYGILTALGMLGLVIAARVTRLTSRPIFFRFLDSIPVLGHVLMLHHNLYLLRNMANLLKADIRVHDGVHLLRGLFPDPRLNSRIDRAAEAIVKGDSLSAAFAEVDLLTRKDRTLLKIGEETGALAEQVSHLAGTYERRLNVALERFLALFEPVMIVCLALVIGFILVGLYLPLFNIIGGGPGR